MTSYVRIVGMILGAVFAAAGLSVAFSLLPLMVVIGMVAGLCTYSAAQDDRGAPGSRSGQRPRSLAALIACGTVAAIYVVIGVVVLLGAASGALLVASMLVLLAYRVLFDHRTEERSDAGPGTVPAPRQAPDHGSEVPALLPADADGATTSDLCRAWRVSYLVLQNVRDPQEWAELAATRRRYLDELDRRDPDGFRRWLEEGARAASDPARYIRSGSSSPQQEDDAAA